MPLVKCLCCDDSYRYAVEIVPSCFKVLSCKSLEELKKYEQHQVRHKLADEPCVSTDVIFYEHPFRFLVVLISASSFSVHHMSSDKFVTAIMFRHPQRDTLDHIRYIKSIFFGLRRILR